MKTILNIVLTIVVLVCYTIISHLFVSIGGWGFRIFISVLLYYLCTRIYV